MKTAAVREGNAAEILYRGKEKGLYFRSCEIQSIFGGEGGI